MSFVNDFNPNIQELAENIFLGPQGELLEKIEHFNDTWDTNLQVTKKFHWKPGTYDMLKAKLMSIMAFHKKANSLSKVVERVQHSDYMLRRFNEQIVRIENSAKDLKRDGIIWRDNTDEIETCLFAIKTRIEQQLSLIPDKFNVAVKVIYEERENTCHDPSVDAKFDNISIQLTMENPDFSILNGNEPWAIIGTFPYAGVISLHVNVNIMKSLNYWTGKEDWECPTLPRDIDSHHWGYNSRQTRCALSTRGMNMPKYMGLFHPYISRPSVYRDYNCADDIVIRDSSMNDEQWERTGVCLGNMQNDILRAAWTFNLVDLTMLTKMWATQYHMTRTGPLNNIRTTFFGYPSFITEEVKNIVGVSDSSACEIPRLINNNHRARQWSLDPEYAITYCKETKCQWSNNCAFYMRHTDEDWEIKKEQLRVNFIFLEAALGRYGKPVDNPAEVLEEFELDAHDGHIEPEDDIFYWGYELLAGECLRLEEVLVKRLKFAKEYQSRVGIDDAKLELLLRTKNESWFELEIRQMDVDGRSESEVKELMMRWAASNGGAMDHENPF